MVKNHKCDLCGKSFTQSGVLNRHILSMSKRSVITNVILVINSIHNGQKGNKCDTCGKRSSISGYVKTHINSVH